MVVQQEVAVVGRLPNFTDSIALTEAVAQAQLKPEQWAQLATKLGDQDIDDTGLLAITPNEEWSKVLDGESAVVKGRTNLLVNGLRKAMGLEVRDFNSAAPQLTPQPTPEASEEVKVKIIDSNTDADPNNIRVSKYFDQGVRYVVQLVAKDDIKASRAKWKAVNKLPPVPKMNPSDQQLSCVLALKKLGHNLLAFDMAVLAPFAERRERWWQLVDYVQVDHGQYLPGKMVPGPATLADWILAWDFVTIVMVICGVCDRGVMERWRDWFV